MQRRGWLVVAVCLWVSGCAAPNKRPPTPGQLSHEWSGRISVQMQSVPPQQMSASFSLQGLPQSGQLDLYSPIGTALATLQWNPQEAFLQQGNQRERFDSLATLTEQVTGTQIPLSELFDWLNGIATPVAGWQADVSELSNGLLTATRSSPAPRVLLRIKLD